MTPTPPTPANGEFHVYMYMYVQGDGGEPPEEATESEAERRRRLQQQQQLQQHIEQGGRRRPVNGMRMAGCNTLARLHTVVKQVGWFEVCPLDWLMKFSCFAVLIGFLFAAVGFSVCCVGGAWQGGDRLFRAVVGGGGVSNAGRSRDRSSALARL